MTMPADDSTIQGGLQRLQGGDVAGAVAVFERITALEPSNGAAFQYLGIARAQAGDATGGLAALRKAAGLLPASAGVQFNLGVALHRAGQFDEARAALEAAIALDPGHAKARAALGALNGTVPATVVEPAAVRPLGGPAAAPPVAEAPPAPPSMSGLGAIGGGFTPAPTTSEAAPAPLPGPPGLGSIGGLSSVGGGAPPPPPPAVAPPGAYTPPPPSGAYVPPASSGQTAYSPARPPAGIMMQEAPSTGQRVLRGLGWGAICAQWWTLLNSFWFLVYGGSSHGAAVAIVFILLGALIFTVTGSVVGLILAAIDADVATGAIVGVVAGLLLFVGELALNGFSASGFFNVIFWFFTGRFVGANIARKIQG
jgi:hypothetical protein